MVKKVNKGRNQQEAAGKQNNNVFSNTKFGLPLSCWFLA
jgi:hypothetical protein